MKNMINKGYSLKDTHNEMQEEIYRLRSQIEDLDEIIAENEAKVSVLKEEDVQLINNIEDLHIDKLELEDKNNALKEENERLRKEEEEYKESIASLQVIQKDLQMVIKENSEKVKLLEEKNIRLNQENRKLESQLLVNKDSIERLELQGTGLKSILEIERIKHSNIEKQIEAIENILENGR